MGEGGAVNIVRNQKLKVIAEAFEIGDETVGAQAVWITHAINVWMATENYLMAMTTNIHTVIWDII